MSAAERYCQQNPAVYCNDFESSSWEGMEHEGDATLVTAGVPGLHTYHGSGSVEALLDDDGTGASFGYRLFGVEQVYVRFYMRWGAEWDRPMHHFFAIHGDQVQDKWSCHGTAGCRPNGIKCLNGATVDTREPVADELPGEPFFYTYFPDMNCDPGNSCDNYADPQAICQGCADRGLPCNNGLECCWGNHFNLNQGVPVSMEQDRWYAVETMIKANSVSLGVGNADGEMALWIDGVLVARHTGMLWRHDDELLLNHFIVWNYFPEATKSYRIWFDNLVIDTSPIGASAGIVFEDDFESGDTEAWNDSRGEP
ncbi:MAG: hypothetical protein WBH85_03605 [Thermoanaerobaculia bacterium]